MAILNSILILLLGTWVHGETQMALSHAIIQAGKIIRGGSLSTYTTYVDFEPVFSYLRKLKDHGDALKLHLDKDISHLEGKDLYAMEHNNSYFTYFHSEGTYGSGNPGCFLIGAEAYKPGTAEEWEDVATMVKKFNDLNEGTDIPRPTKLIVPVRVDVKSSALKYVGLGSKAELKLDSTVGTNLNLLKTLKAFPLYNINSKQFEFRENATEEYVLCKLIRTRKLAQKATWLALAQRKLVEVEKFLKETKEAKEELTNFLAKFSSFSYTVGNKLGLESPGRFDDVQAMMGHLDSHSALNIIDSGRYALANVFLDKYINALKEKLGSYLLAYEDPTNVYKTMLSKGINPLLTIVNNNIKGVSDLTPFLAAFKQSIRASSFQYDTAAKVLLQEFQYQSPKRNDLLQLHKVLLFPVLTNEYEVTVNVPEQHLLEGEDMCQFVGPTFLLANCQKLPDLEETYRCQSDQLLFSDPCCVEIREMQTISSIERCGSVFYTSPPELALLRYDSHDFVYITSAKKESQIETQCQDGTEAEFKINETTLLSPNCSVKQNHGLISAFDTHIGPTRMVPLRTLFMETFNLLKGKELEPQKPDRKYVPPIDMFENGTLEFFGLNPLELGIISGGSFLFLLPTLACVCAIFFRKRSKKKKEKAAENYVMASHTKREMLPIYSPPTAPNTNFQYI